MPKADTQQLPPVSKIPVLMLSKVNNQRCLFQVTAILGSAESADGGMDQEKQKVRERMQAVSLGDTEACPPSQSTCLSCQIGRAHV